MQCQKCHTTFEFVSIANGDEYVCPHCAHLLYKNENGKIIFLNAIIQDENKKIDSDSIEKISREKEIRFKELQDRKEKENEFRVRFLQEKLALEQEEAIRKQKEREEQERLLQIQIEEEQKLKVRLLQIQQEKEQLEYEQYKKEQFEIESKKIAWNQEEIKQLIAIQIAEETKKQETILLSKLENEKNLQLQLDEERKKRELVELELQKLQSLEINQNQTAVAEGISAHTKPQIQFSAGRQTTIQKKSSTAYLKFVLPVLTVILIVLATIKYQQIFSTINTVSKEKNILAKSDSNLSDFTITQLNDDTIFIQKIKNTLLKKGILSWNKIIMDDIKNIEIINKLSATNYDAEVHLEDKDGTKSTAMIRINTIDLENITTKKITYSNIAPVNAWFSFSTIPNCTIQINTHNNPIQLKTCMDCPIKKYVCNETNEIQLEYATNFSIKSDNKYDAIVDFSYTPN